MYNNIYVCLRLRIVSLSWKVGCEISSLFNDEAAADHKDKRNNLNMQLSVVVFDYGILTTT